MLLPPHLLATQLTRNCFDLQFICYVYIVNRSVSPFDITYMDFLGMPVNHPHMRNNRPPTQDLGILWSRVLGLSPTKIN